MTRTCNRSIAVAVLCLSTLVACGPDASRSPLGARQVPGTLTVVLTSPRADVGGISLILRGPGIATPAAVRVDQQLFLTDSAPGSNEVRLAVVGEHLSGPVIRFPVPDVNAVAAYSVDLVSVVDHANALQDDLAPYTARLVIQN